jgi:hypothetical protein
MALRGVQVSNCILVGAIAVGLPSFASCVVGLVAVIRAKPEDIPAVVRALNRRARRAKRREVVYVVPPNRHTQTRDSGSVAEPALLRGQPGGHAREHRAGVD